MSYFKPPSDQDVTRPDITWWGPPDHEVGVELPVEKEIARSEGARITLRSLAVFSTGIEMNLLAEWLPGTLGEQSRVHVEPQSPQFLRLALEFADGRRATNMNEDSWHDDDDDEVLASPLLVSDGWLYGPADTDARLNAWIWGIPEVGDPFVVVEWPAAEIAVARVPLDGDAIRAAAMSAGVQVATFVPETSSGFFETTPPLAARRERPPRQSWERPRGGQIGGLPGIRTALGVSPEAAMLLTDVIAFPDGLECALELRIRDPELDHVDKFRQIVRPTEVDGRLSPLFARLGARLADGTKVTNVERTSTITGERRPGPVLKQTSGGGGSGGITMRFWLWPLPSDAALTVVCEWPAYGIPETQTTIDAAAIIKAAGRAASVLEPAG